MDSLKPNITNHEITVRNHMKPGDLGYITYLHGILYSIEYGFDNTFESYVAGPLGEFIKTKTNMDKIWIVEQGGEIKGTIAIVKYSEKEAQLRWFLLHPDIRGRGIGKTLLKNAIDFSIESGYSSIFLWTVSNLSTATKLYKSFGFQLTEEKEHKLWGNNILEQRYDITL